MKEKKKAVFLPGVPSAYPRHFQPLVVGVVCAVLVSLLLIVGILDWRTLKTTLSGYMMSRYNRTAIMATKANRYDIMLPVVKTAFSRTYRRKVSDLFP